MKLLVAVCVCVFGLTVAVPRDFKKSALEDLLEEILDMEGKEVQGRTKLERDSHMRKESSKRTLEKRGSFCVAPPDCVFPFTFNDIKYSSCTTADSSYSWCSHSEEYSFFSGYSACSCIGCQPHSDCVFPFTYKGATYSECTDADNEEVQWCSTTAEYEEGSNTYKNCDCFKCLEPPECTFPFTYNGEEYYECTQDGSYANEFWCSHDKQYSSDYSECICLGK